MSLRPDISAALGPGETLLWQGAPKPGRPAPRRDSLIAALLYLAAAAVLVFAWYLEIFWGHVPALHLAVFGLIGTAAFFTWLGLRLTVLNSRRARARDARTAFGITDRRAIVLIGPHTAALDLGPGMTAEATGDTLTISGPEGRLRFERLDDAGAARDTLTRQIEGQT